MPTNIPDNVFNEFFAECQEIISRITTNLTVKNPAAISAEIIDSLYRDVHTLKGSSQLFGLNFVGTIAHAVEASLAPVREKKTKLDHNLIDCIFRCIDLIEKILKNPQLDFDKDQSIERELNLLLPKLISISSKKFSAEIEINSEFYPSASHDEKLKIEKPADKPVVKKDPGPEKIFVEEKVVKTEIKEEVHQAPKVKVEKNSHPVEEQTLESSTIRVQVNLLDKLMNLAGEMVLTRNQVLQYARTSDDNDFLALTQKLDLVTSELQDSVMKTRMQPIGSIFSKFQRVVRDLARDLGKNIELTIEGAETELDKSLIEAIKDPLTHIVRNSCDHGLENVADRKKNNKPEVGTLVLKAYHEGGQVVIEIKDDGRGVDPQKILAKALEKKLITPEKSNTMTVKEIQELIFAPGFSTAEQVSSVSGRGVGMDVVKTNVERVGGMIDLQSTAGQGTTLKLRIPLTLAIVPAMIIRSGKNFFAIPQVKLQELIRVDMEEDAGKVEVLQEQLMYRLRGDLLPLIDIDQVFQNQETSTRKTIYNIVVLKTDNSSYGLIVDEICDTADIVVKPLSNLLKKIILFSGATIMGDGGVALILDIQGIAESCKLLHKLKDSKKELAITSSLFKEESEYLFFHLNQTGIFSLPLILVQRLEEFPAKIVEVSGVERVVQYRGSLLPLIYLNEYFNYKTKEDTKTSDNISVIVVSKRNRLFGLVVNEIIDILSTTAEIMPQVKENKDILGTIISPDKHVITVINALAIVDETMGFKTDMTIKKKMLKAKVLFAEDTIFFVKQVKKVLEEIGIEVIHAIDGAKALDILKKSDAGTFQLILSDIEMPQMNGFEFARAVRADEQFKKIPMIALTTRFREADVKMGKEVGFNRYLEKLKSDELIEAIHEIIGGSK